MKTPLVRWIIDRDWTSISNLALRVARNFSTTLILTFLTVALLAQAPDSLTIPTTMAHTGDAINSITTEFTSTLDSLNVSYQSKLASIDSEHAALTRSIDSLTNLNIDASAYVNRFDSLAGKRAEVISEFQQKADKAKNSALSRIDKVQLTPGMEGPVGQIKSKISGLDVTDGKIPRLTSLDLPALGTSQMDEITNAVGDLKGNLKLPAVNTPLGNVSDIAGEAGQITEQISGVTQDIKAVAGGNVADVQHIPDAIEKQAQNIEGVSTLEETTQLVEGYKEQLSAVQDPEQLKAEAQQMVVKEAVNHFAGKEEVLKNSMDQLAKYKQQYSNITSLRDLPKRPPNPMKGKPFIDRLLPGIYFQVQSKDHWLVDFNPYAGYRISGRFVAGVGWNQRFAYDNRNEQFVSRERIFGPRAFIDSKLLRGFIAHTEIERMNTYVPNRQTLNAEPGHREWIWSFQMGLKKQYTLYKNLQGTALIQYNFLNQYFKTPYIDRLNARMGLEYFLRKKVVKAPGVP
jgi:hypothetical protein